MKCLLKKDMLSRFADSDLVEREADFVRAHIEKCGACKQEMDVILEMNKMIRSLPEVLESADFDFQFNQKLNKALGAAEEAGFYERVWEKILTGLRELSVPKIPILARAAVTFTFMIAAVFTALYYTEPGEPSVAGIDGTGYVRGYKTDEWRKLIAGDIIHKGDTIRSEDASRIDVALGAKYNIRLKGDASISIAKLSPKRSNGVVGIKLSKGNLLVDIGEGFKGSVFKVNTDTADIQALGTKFMVSSEKEDNKIWVGVLEGKVKVSQKGEFARYAKATREVLVKEGMKAEVSSGVPAKTLPLLEMEWRNMTELYMLGKKTKVALLLSAEKNRVLQLLGPCPIFITDEKPRVIPEQLEEAAYLIDKAIKMNDKSLHLEGIAKLQEIVDADPKAVYNIQLLLFIGAYYEYIDEHVQAIKTFDFIPVRYPKTSLLSLAECASAYIYESALSDQNIAKGIYGKIIEKYSGTPESDFAKERISKISKHIS